MVLSGASPDLAFREGVLVTQSAVILLCDWVQNPTLLDLSFITCNARRPIDSELLCNRSSSDGDCGAEVFLRLKSMGKVNMRPVVSFKTKNMQLQF